jgi:hypothetical protein
VYVLLQAQVVQVVVDRCVCAQAILLHHMLVVLFA